MRIGAVEKPCLIVAELGLNHNGDLATAIKMVHAAAEAGADVVKVQAYTADEFCGQEETYSYRVKRPSWSLEQSNIPLGVHLGEMLYLSQWTKVTERQLDMFRRCQLSEPEVLAVVAECRKVGVSVVATATDLDWVRLLLDAGVDAIKVGSDDIVHEPLLEALAALRAPVIISTGMADQAEVLTAAATLGPSLVAALHCVSLYPTPVPEANLSRMDSLRLLLPGVSIGFSDHTMGAMVSGAAIARGAEMIEKHFTLDQSSPGPDHWFSGTSNDLRVISTFARECPPAIGSGRVSPGLGEKRMAMVARRSIVAARDMVSGEVISSGDLAFKRPGTGLPPTMRAAIVGMVTTRDVSAGEPLTVEAVMHPPLGKAN